MRLPASLSMPWDMVVFLTITTVGFGFAVQKLRVPSSAAEETTAVSTTETNKARDIAWVQVEPGHTNAVIDLGCLDDKLSGERIFVDRGTIRVKGKLCRFNQSQTRRLSGVRVRNLTAGSEGTVFLKDLGNAFITDLLGVSGGRNIIEIGWRDESSAGWRSLQAEVFEK